MLVSIIIFFFWQSISFSFRIRYDEFEDEILNLSSQYKRHTRTLGLGFALGCLRGYTGYVIFSLISFNYYIWSGYLHNRKFWTISLKTWQLPSNFLPPTIGDDIELLNNPSGKYTAWVPKAHCHMDLWHFEACQSGRPKIISKPSPHMPDN